jgi:hypothetical protein
MPTDSPALGERIICGPGDRCFVLDTLPGVRQVIRRLDIGPRAFAALSPGRLLDTRSGPGLATVDHQFEGTGPIAAGTSLALAVAGRAGVPADASTVALNVTVTQPASAGYVTVYPCGETPPLASSVNFAAGQTVANAAIARVGAGGAVCFFSSSRTHLVVDVNGSVPGSVPSISSILPQRILETRSGPGDRTADHRYEAIGALTGGTSIELPVAGRGGVPPDARSAVLNLTVTQPAAAGYITAFPCDGAPPNASNVNYVAGQTVANGVVTKLSPGGSVCLFTSATTHLVVDVNGYLPPTVTSLTALPPARLLETRAGPGMDTIDHRHAGVGKVGERSTYVLDVMGRGGVGFDADSVLLNVTVRAPHSAGYVTLYPCDGLPPNASNLNFVAGETRANSAVVRVATNGVVCVYSSTLMDLVIDVVGYWR